MKFLVRVHVVLKPVVNDPPGQAIHGALRSLGFAGVERVRAGKYFEIALDSADATAAEATASEMCRKLLANPVIEDFRFAVEELKTQPASAAAG